MNSEEGYRNLERFFFGDVRVELMLDNLDALRDSAGDDSVTHQAEVQVAIRQLPVLLHDQQIAHHSQVLLERERLKQGEPVPLFTAFCSRRRRPRAERPATR